MSNDKKPKERNKRPNKSEPPTAFKQNPPATAQQEAEDHGNHGEVKKSPKIFFIKWGSGLIDWIDAHNGLMTALATVAIACLTWFISSDSHDQLDAVRGQQAVMQSQLDEIKLEQRPWVAISATLKPIEIGKPIVIQIAFSNVGHKPAFNMISWGNYTVTLPGATEPPDQKAEFDALDRIKLGDGTVLFPGFNSVNDVEVIQSSIVATKTLDDLKNGALKIWFIARVEYTDGKNDRHFTNFRGYYSPIFNGFIGVSPGNSAN